MSRADYLDALVGTTADDIARDLDAATEPDDYWTALHAALLRLGWHGMKEAPEENPVLLRIPPAAKPRGPRWRVKPNSGS